MLSFEDWYNENYLITYNNSEMSNMKLVWEAALTAFKAELAQELCADCENGVKWLNEHAADQFKKQYPNLSRMINEWSI